MVVAILGQDFKAFWWFGIRILCLGDFNPAWFLFIMALHSFDIWEPFLFSFAMVVSSNCCVSTPPWSRSPLRRRTFFDPRGDSPRLTAYNTQEALRLHFQHLFLSQHTDPPADLSATSPMAPPQQPQSLRSSSVPAPCEQRRKASKQSPSHQSSRGTIPLREAPTACGKDPQKTPAVSSWCPISKGQNLSSLKSPQL